MEARVGTYSYLKGLVKTSDFALYEMKSQERKTYDLTSAYHSICCVVVGHRSAMKAGKAVKKLLQQFRLLMTKAHTKIVTVEVVRNGHILVIF